MTHIHIKQNIHKHRTQNCRRISPFGINPVEKAHKARTRWYRGPFHRFINTRFLKSIKKKGMDASNKKKSVIDKSTEWSTIPACPSPMCFFNRGDTEGTDSSKI